MPELGFRWISWLPVCQGIINFFQPSVKGKVGECSNLQPHKRADAESVILDFWGDKEWAECKDENRKDLKPTKSVTCEITGFI